MRRGAIDADHGNTPLGHAVMCLSSSHKQISRALGFSKRQASTPTAPLEGCFYIKTVSRRHSECVCRPLSDMLRSNSPSPKGSSSVHQALIGGSG